MNTTIKTALDIWIKGAGTVSYHPLDMNRFYEVVYESIKTNDRLTQEDIALAMSEHLKWSDDKVLKESGKFEEKVEAILGFVDFLKTKKEIDILMNINKMSVHAFMTDNFAAVKEVIDELEDTFMSHDFIQKFTQRYQHEYIELLRQQSTKSPQNPYPFKEIHSQMARFLAEKQTRLGIKQQGKESSINIFGASTLNEKWNKVG